MARGVFDLSLVDQQRVFDVGDLQGLFTQETYTPGDRTDPASLNREQAQAILSEIVRLVADLPKESSPQVVWTLGANELLVHTDKTNISLSSGVITITLQVECDEVRDQARIGVPFGVGTLQRPAGLVMSTLNRIGGPLEITEVWTDAIIAFAWECVLELCRTIAGNVGEDSRGRALIPGLVAAGSESLLIEPMARHQIST